MQPHCWSSSLRASRSHQHLLPQEPHLSQLSGPLGEAIDLSWVQHEGDMKLYSSQWGWRMGSVSFMFWSCKLLLADAACSSSSI